MTAPGYTAMKWKSTVRIKLGAPENKADRKLVEMVRTGLVACVRISTGSQQLEDSLIKLSRVVHGKLVDIRVHMAGTNPIEAGLTPRAKPTRGARRQRFRLAGPGSRCRRRSPRHGVTPPVARQAGRRTPALRSAPISRGPLDAGGGTSTCAAKMSQKWEMSRKDSTGPVLPCALRAGVSGRNAGRDPCRHDGRPGAPPLGWAPGPGRKNRSASHRLAAGCPRCGCGQGVPRRTARAEPWLGRPGRAARTQPHRETVRAGDKLPHGSGRVVWLRRCKSPSV